MRECSRYTTLTYNYLMSIVIVVVARTILFGFRRAIEHCNSARIIFLAIPINDSNLLILSCRLKNYPEFKCF